MNKAFSLIPIIFGLGLATMTYPLGLFQQEVYATFYSGSSSEDVIAIAYPSGQPGSKTTTLGSINSSNQHRDNPTQLPTTLPIK
jgi:hypothetical protein